MLFRIFLLFGLVCSTNLPAQYATYITVAQDGSGDHTSIQEAIHRTKSFPDQPITIFIKNGVYQEKVRLYAWNTNLSLVGESVTGTIIRWDDHFKTINKGRNSTFLTYTLSIEANDVTIRNLTVQNSAGPVGQALALSVTGDRVVVENCRLLGHQDTLYCSGAGRRQYFKDCYIEGTTDFVFGNAVAYFDHCELHALSNSYITAASTPEGQQHGLVFYECNLTAKAGVDEVYLGRPWRAYAQTVFLNCTYGDHILPEGWDDWGKTSNHQTVFYGEWAPQEALGGRVAWAKKLKKRHLKQYTSRKVFKDWLP